MNASRHREDDGAREDLPERLHAARLPFRHCDPGPHRENPGRSHGSTGMIPGTEAESVREPTTGRLRQARHYCAAAAGRLPGCCLGERLFGMQKDSRSCDNDRDFRDGPTKELSA